MSGYACMTVEQPTICNIPQPGQSRVQCVKVFPETTAHASASRYSPFAPTNPNRHADMPVAARVRLGQPHAAERADRVRAIRTETGMSRWRSRLSIVEVLPKYKIQLAVFPHIVIIVVTEPGSQPIPPSHPKPFLLHAGHGGVGQW